jgi:hypothetical protein
MDYVLTKCTVTNTTIANAALEAAVVKKLPTEQYKDLQVANPSPTEP